MANNNPYQYKLTGTNGSEVQLSLLGPSGPTGPANVLNIGTVTTGETGTPASATITGSSPTQTLNLILPKGNTGSTGPQGNQGAAGPNTITTSTSTNLTGFIYGNGTNIAGAVEASSAASPNKLVLRNASGAAEFNANETGEAAVTGFSFGSGGAGFYGIDYVGDGYGVYAEGGLVGVYGNSSNEGTGVVGYSQNGTGASSTSAGTSATYHHKFGDTGNNRSAVERVRGWFVWFYNGLVGRLKTADITENREWTLPDESGTVALARNTGKTVFVDAGTGNDTRGTTSKYSVSIPFATIGAAMAASAIGDTVRVRAGSYIISSTINLNNEGNLHLEEGAVVTCNVTSAPVFTLSLDQAKVISGGGQFVIAGTTTKFWQQTGGTLNAQLCSIECYSILTSSNSARIFEVTTGVLVVQAGTVYTPTSTIAYCEGTSSNVNYRVPFTYCARMVEMPTPTTQAQFSCVCQTIQCFGTKCFRVVGGTLGIDYETLVDATGICTFFSFEYGNDATTNGTTIRGGRAITYSTNPCINFSTPTGTNKVLRFYGDPFFFTNGPNSITAASARTVLSSYASSNKPVGTPNITLIGNYFVDAALG